MRLSSKTKAWFDLPDDPDKARFEVLHLLSGDLEEIDDEANQEMVELEKKDDGTLSAKSVVKIKKKIKREKTVLKAVINWENVNDSDGNPLECNDANKLRVCREQSESDWLNFYKFLADSRQTLAEKVKTDEEAARGN